MVLAVTYAADTRLLGWDCYVRDISRNRGKFPRPRFLAGLFNDFMACGGVFTDYKIFNQLAYFW